MECASVARARYGSSRSASENTATEAMRSSCSARMTRAATAPRLAIRTFWNIALPAARPNSCHRGRQTVLWASEIGVNPRLGAAKESHGRDQGAVGTERNGVEDRIGTGRPGRRGGYADPARIDEDGDPRHGAEGRRGEGDPGERGAARHRGRGAGDDGVEAPSPRPSPVKGRGRRKALSP